MCRRRCRRRRPCRLSRRPLSNIFVSGMARRCDRRHRLWRSAHCASHITRTCFSTRGALLRRRRETRTGEWRWTYYRAVIQSERGGGDALVASLRRVVERAPQFGPAWLRLGEAEFKAGRYDRAEEAWRKARDLPVESDSTASPRHLTEIPLSAYASLGRARVALVRGEFDSARQTLEQVLRYYSAVRFSSPPARGELQKTRTRELRPNVSSTGLVVSRPMPRTPIR